VKQLVIQAHDAAIADGERDVEAMAAGLRTLVGLARQGDKRVIFDQQQRTRDALQAQLAESQALAGSPVEDQAE
jgi:hypothetical protein